MSYIALILFHTRRLFVSDISRRFHSIPIRVHVVIHYEFPFDSNKQRALSCAVTLAGK